MGLDTVYWDPFDVDIDTSPYDTWRALRDHAPVYRNDRYDFYALSRYADVEYAHRQPQLFSSSHGTVLEIMGEQPMQTSMMIFNDPPEHTRLRSLVSRAFTPRRVAELETAVRGYCHDLLTAWEPGEEFDFVQQFAALLPAMVIAELLGVPEPDRAAVRADIDTAFHLEPGVGMINEISVAAMGHLGAYLTSLVAERAARPLDDLVSALTQTELTERECVEFTILLITAGTETVGKLLGWGALLLGEYPDQQRLLRDDPSRVPNAVEELLRFEAPSPVQGRWTTADVELHGTTIPENSKVLLLTGSAGRDERKYDDPDRFDVTRRFDHHVSFGFGVHFCLGASLARLQGRVGLESALARTGSWTSDRSRSEALHTSTVRGWQQVSVTSA